MKNNKFLFLGLAILTTGLFFISKSSSAQTIQTGDATSETVVENVVNTNGKRTVLGTTHKGQKEQRDETRLIYLLIFTVLGYAGIRVLRGKDNLVKVFAKKSSLQLRIQALWMFLL